MTHASEIHQRRSSIDGSRWFDRASSVFVLGAGGALLYPGLMGGEDVAWRLLSAVMGSSVLVIGVAYANRTFFPPKLVVHANHVMFRNLGVSITPRWTTHRISEIRALELSKIGGGNDSWTSVVQFTDGSRIHVHSEDFSEEDARRLFADLRRIQVAEAGGAAAVR